MQRGWGGGIGEKGNSIKTGRWAQEKRPHGNEGTRGVVVEGRGHPLSGSLLSLPPFLPS